MLASGKTIGRVLGIEVKISYLLLVLVGFMGFNTLISQGMGSALTSIIVYAALAFFVFLHELGHSLAAMKDGVGVQSIWLHPLGGVAMLSGGIPGPASEIFIALAGPFVSLLLAALFYLFLNVLGISSAIIYQFFTLNMFLALFNFLPIFPLDGGRVLTAILVMKMGIDRGVERACQIAKIGIFGLGIFGMVMLFSGDPGGINLVLIAVMLHFMGGQEMQARAYASSYAYGYNSSSMSSAYNVFGGYSQTANNYNSQPGFFSKLINNWKAKKQRKLKEKQTANREEVDKILRKVNEEGIGSLTDEERQTLNNASSNLRNK
jgi:Zn-dependent protease